MSENNDEDENNNEDVSMISLNKLSISNCMTDSLDSSLINYSMEEKSVISDGCKQMELFLFNFAERINCMMLIEKHTNMVYELSIQLMEQYRQLLVTFSKENSMVELATLNNSTDFVTGILTKYSSTYKRQKNLKKVTYLLLQKRGLLVHAGKSYQSKIQNYVYLD